MDVQLRVRVREDIHDMPEPDRRNQQYPIVAQNDKNSHAGYQQAGLVDFAATLPHHTRERALPVRAIIRHIAYVI